MIYRLRHTTRYHYSDIVTLSENEACLLPREMPYQRVCWAQLSISPGESLRQDRLDAFGNRIALFAIDTPHTQLEVTLEALVMTSPRSAPPPTAMGWEHCRDLLADDRQPGFREAQPFVENSAYIERRPLLAAWAEDCFPAGGDLMDCVSRLNRRIHEAFCYDSEFSDLETTPSQVLKYRRGVCQDFAHLAIATLRSVGLAARYVSGYLETRPPPGQPRLTGADASHAWFSVLIPGWGWLDFDPTNGILAGERHLLLGWGRDYEDVAPLKGVVTGGGQQRLEVEVDVVPSAAVKARDTTASGPGDHPAAPLARLIPAPFSGRLYPLPCPPSSRRDSMQDLLIWLATGFGLGHSPWAPGTVGSLLGLPVAWWLFRLPLGTRLTITLVLIVLAVPVCHFASLWLGGGDLPQIVLDEWVALPIAVLAFSRYRRRIILPLGYLLFRLFDISKLSPVREIEGIGGGLGIVADDAMAALYAALTLILLVRLTRRYWQRESS